MIRGNNFFNAVSSFAIKMNDKLKIHGYRLKKYAGCPGWSTRIEFIQNTKAVFLSIKRAVNTIIEAILQIPIEKFIYDNIDIARNRFDNKGIFSFSVIPADFRFGSSFCKAR